MILATAIYESPRGIEKMSMVIHGTFDEYKPPRIGQMVASVVDGNGFNTAAVIIDLDDQLTREQAEDLGEVAVQPGRPYAFVQFDQ